MVTKTYIVAENWGKGFIEHSESAKFTISGLPGNCLLYTSPSPRDGLLSRMPSSA